MTAKLREYSKRVESGRLHILCFESYKRQNWQNCHLSSNKKYIDHLVDSGVEFEVLASELSLTAAGTAGSALWPAG